MAPSLRRPLSGPGFAITQQVHLRAKPLGPQPVQRPCTHWGPLLRTNTPVGRALRDPFSQPTPRWAGRSGTPSLRTNIQWATPGDPSQRTNTQWAGLLGTPSQNQHPVGRPTQGPLLSEPKPGGQAHSGTPFSEPTPGGQHPGSPSDPTPGGQSSSGTLQNQRRGGWAHSVSTGLYHSLPPAGTWADPRPSARPQSLCFSCRTLPRDALQQPLSSPAWAWPPLPTGCMGLTVAPGSTS